MAAKPKKRFRKLKITALVILILIAGTLIWRPISRRVYREFYRASVQSVELPGQWDWFCPQGIRVREDESACLISGYAPFRLGPSKIYTVSEETGTHRCEVYTQDGKAIRSHFGGITTLDGYVVCGGEHRLWVFRIEDITQNDTASLVCSIPIRGIGSYLFSDENDVMAGEFNIRPFIRSPTSWTDADGTDNNAVIYRYAREDVLAAIETAAAGGEPKLEPRWEYLVPDRVQGAAFVDGTVILTRSLLMMPSRYEVYSLPTSADAWDGSVPVSFLDSRCRIRTIFGPMMSEDLDYRNGHLYCLSESSTPIYLALGRLMGYTDIFKLNFNALLAD